MESVLLTLDRAETRSRGGPTLVVLNSPSLALERGSGNSPGGYNAGPVLVGFDRTPSVTTFDAIVPPYSQAVIHVPTNVNVVSFLTPSGNAYVVRYPGTPAATSTILVDWLPCTVASQITPVPELAGLNRGITSVNNPVSIPFVRSIGIAPPQPVPWSYSPGHGGDNMMMLRPRLSPALADPFHLVLALNTVVLFDSRQQSLLNHFSHPTQEFLVIFRLTVTMSVAGLLVIGDDDLTVGSLGAGEIARVVLAAGVPYTFDFGDDGMHLNPNGRASVNGLNWKVYAGVAATIDGTIVTS